MEIDTINKWHKCVIRTGVYDTYRSKFSKEFLDFSNTLLGNYKCIAVNGKQFIYFENIDDSFKYTLTFGDPIEPIIECNAFYYCPYIPLTSSGTLISNSYMSATTFNTRYGII